MASREELLIIRAARAGQAAAQLALGKRYLFGGSGLPKNFATALYWLDRAATQDEEDAWILIGTYVPFDVACQATHPQRLRIWYERAFEAGLAQAGLVFAKLVLQHDRTPPATAVRSKALAALEAAARAGIADAQWLLAQQLSASDSSMPGNAASAGREQDAHAAEGGGANTMLQWAARAAESGIVPAQRALAEHAWAIADHVEFLRWALPLARDLSRVAAVDASVPLPADDITLLSRCAQALLSSDRFDADEVEQFWTLAAAAGERNAQFHLGLWLAKMDACGKRITDAPGLANYKKAIRWLTSAGEHGIADAWYALSKIYLKPECSQRNLADAQYCLERAASAGHRAAQLELGSAAWRTRRDDPAKDIRAVYWLLKAAAQDCAEANTLLRKIATPATPAAWAQMALRRLTTESASLYPFLVARIELAALFGLSRSEALLLDLHDADRGHCLVVEIRADRPRSRRRLILIEKASEREALDRIVRRFENVDCGSEGPEGNYRQRLYRLKTLLK